MDAVLRAKHNHSYIDLTQSDTKISREPELNDLLSLCYQHQSNNLLLSEHNLSADFFNLRTGLAGLALQKFANYQVRVAVLLPPGADHNERFRELMYEMNQSNQIRFYSDQDSAEHWLTS